jgi:hypothetical protein
MKQEINRTYRSIVVVVPLLVILTMTVRSWTDMVRSKTMEHMSMYKTRYSDRSWRQRQESIEVNQVIRSHITNHRDKSLVVIRMVENFVSGWTWYKMTHSKRMRHTSPLKTLHGNIRQQW